MIETNLCQFCGLPLIYDSNTCCPNGCKNKSVEWKEIKLLRNELNASTQPDTKKPFGCNEAKEHKCAACGKNHDEANCPQLLNIMEKKICESCGEFVNDCKCKSGQIIQELTTQIERMRGALEACLPPWEDDGSASNGHVCCEISYGDVRQIRKALKSIPHSQQIVNKKV